MDRSPVINRHTVSKWLLSFTCLIRSIMSTTSKKDATYTKARGMPAPPSRSNRSKGGAPRGVGGPFGRLVSRYGTLTHTRPLFPKFFENFFKSTNCCTNPTPVAKITHLSHKSHTCCINHTLHVNKYHIRVFSHHEVFRRRRTSPHDGIVGPANSGRSRKIRALCLPVGEAEHAALQHERPSFVATRRFVRRQDAWFLKDPRVAWLEGTDLVGQALSVLERAES